ncbi:MAG: EamA family transporter [Limimaricola sp.]|uniref:DMT family transporter n=1 Tax=Limimaricola sp. TaxID=2211665 RepID=UPI001D3921FC|nr:DMT family transporter [Limimaricola sp.]MBI1416734.1 EamA family transporter [Limimaricola sp.]
MENIRGAILMVLAMLGFAIEDMFIKQMSGGVPLGQILMSLGGGGALVFGIWAHLRGARVLGPDLWHPAILVRNGCEAVGTIGYTSAIFFSPLSTATAIAQAIPLLVTMGAALFFAEPVGWRRWSAILAGFAGVMLVVQPGGEGFVPASLFAVMGAVGLAGRDLASRRVPARVISVQLACYGFLTLVPTGLFLLAVTGDRAVIPDGTDGARLLAALGIGIFAYYAITAASRLGDVSVIAPYRYARLIFGITIGMIAFGERPDTLALAGSAVIVASGLYTFLREARLRRASQTRAAAV